MIVRLRIVLPDRRTSSALLVSLAAHLLLVTLILAAGTIRGTSAPSRPALMVRLTAGTRPQAPARQTTTKAPEKTPEADAPEPEPPAPKPKPKPRRVEADAPKTVATEPEPVAARPETLRETDEEPPGEAPAEEQPPAGTDGDGTGIDLPEGPIAGGVAGLETDEPLTADWYVGLVVARLSDAWRQRPVLPAGADTRRVVLGFTILRDGRVQDVHVTVPSGYAPLDYSAKRAVQSIDRFAPLPSQYEGDQLTARFVFELVPSEAR